MPRVLIALMCLLAGAGVRAGAAREPVTFTIEGLRPDIAVIGANKSRTENYDYEGRIMRALGRPAVVLPQHWTAGNPITADALDNVNRFAASIKAASPATRVVIPKYFEPMEFR